MPIIAIIQHQDKFDYKLLSELQEKSRIGSVLQPNGIRLLFFYDNSIYSLYSQLLGGVRELTAQDVLRMSCFKQQNPTNIRIHCPSEVSVSIYFGQGAYSTTDPDTKEPQDFEVAIFVKGEWMQPDIAHKLKAKGCDIGDYRHTDPDSKEPYTGGDIISYCSFNNLCNLILEIEPILS